MPNLNPIPHARPGRSRWLLSVAMVGVLAAGPAAAAPSVFGAGVNAKPVADEQLADMRGRLLESEAMRFFGVQLNSSWQNSDGLVMTAMIQLDVDFTKGTPTATLHAGYEHNCNSCTDESVDIPDSALSATLGADGLKSVSGAVQSTEISGNDNSALNSMRVQISEEDSIHPVTPGTGGILLDGTTTKAFSDGSAIQLQMENNSIGISMQGPDGTSLVTQSINGSSSGQIAQHVKLFGNNNVVQNNVDVMIRIDPSIQALSSAALDNALSMMKGMGF